ncbi:MAG: two-component regulator propeller domain-containing protein [Polyangia bacterium]
MVGNIGAIADRMQVNPSTGAVERIDNLQVTSAQVQGSELAEHLIRVVAVWHVLVDLNGTFDGTAYLGGFHGFYAFHGLTADCGCLAFEEHQHYITDTAIGSADVKGLALTADGDLWAGDRDFVALLPQRSKGPTTGFFDDNFTIGLDVFPQVRDEVDGLAVDAAGGLYVASDGNGLAYLKPATYAPVYWSSATTLPQNHLHAVAIDRGGTVWVGTNNGGVARLAPATSAWTYYTQASGLPSDRVHALYFDKLTSAGKMYLATDNGVAIMTP